MSHVYDFYKPNLASEYPVSFWIPFHFCITFTFWDHKHRKTTCNYFPLWWSKLSLQVSLYFCLDVTWRIAFDCSHPFTFTHNLLIEFQDANCNKFTYFLCCRLLMESFHKLVTSWLLILAIRISVTSKSLMLILVITNICFINIKLNSFKLIERVKPK